MQPATAKAAHGTPAREGLEIYGRDARATKNSPCVGNLNTGWKPMLLWGASKAKWRASAR